MECYNKRKAAREVELEAEAKRLSDKSKFIDLVCSGKLKLMGRSKSELGADISKSGLGKGYPLLSLPLLLSFSMTL